jgi:hypothetical protein
VALASLFAAPIAAAGPSTAPCPPGQGPTTISKRVSLTDAAKLGAVKLTSKGGYNGDAVAVDATWKPAPVPVTVQIDIEFTGGFPGAPTAADVEKSIEKNLPEGEAADGTKVKFDIVARERAPGASPSPCFHQAQLTSKSDFRGEAGEPDGDPMTEPQSGEWPTGRGADGDRQIWTHESLHLAGLEDQYVQVFRIGSKDIPIPDSVDIADRAQVEAWAKSKGIDPSKGKAGTKPKPGHENDIMGDVFGKEKLTKADLNKFALIGKNKLTIEARPGDILLNKDGSAQNLAVGAPFELTVSPGKPGHADGLVAYCIDLRHHVPSEGQGFDVLGPAGAQPEAAMKYLQRVLEVAAALQPTALTETPGAQDAIWRISDDTFLEDGAAIYAMAGVPDETFNAPHYVDPNAASPETRAVSPTGVLPEAPPVSYISELRAKPAKLRAGKRSKVRVTIKLQAAGDKVRFELQRRSGSEWRRVKKLGTEKAKPGKTTLKLTLPAQRPGLVRLVAIGDASSAVAPLKVR